MITNSCPSNQEWHISRVANNRYVPIDPFYVALTSNIKSFELQSYIELSNQELFLSLNIIMNKYPWISYVRIALVKHHHRGSSYSKTDLFCQIEIDKTLLDSLQIVFWKKW